MHRVTRVAIACTAIACANVVGQIGIVGHARAEEKSQTTIFSLRNSAAEQLADALRASLDDGSEVRIIADPVSNSLLVKASAEELKGIQAIVQRLDRPKRVLFVEILIAELDGGSRSIAPENDDIAGWIARQTKAKRLVAVERARMTTLEDQESMVQVGRTMSVPTGSTFAGGRARTTQFQVRQYGTIVQLTPRRSGDDEVVVAINVERSRPSAPTSAPAETDAANVPAPPGDSTFTLQSTVRVSLGKTTLIGSKEVDGQVQVVLCSIRAVDEK